MNKKNKNYQKILIHDYFENFGGGERLINILSKYMMKYIDSKIRMILIIREKK